MFWRPDRGAVVPRKTGGMEPSPDSPETELVRRSFDALTRGDYAVLESSLAEDARWRTVEEGATNCEGRDTIIAMMRRNLGGRLRGAIEEASLIGSRVIVGFRPEQPADAAGRPLERGIAYMVVTIAGGEINELKGCADRAAATAYAKPGGA
jgi:ketosteroid isomerase-like protein